MDVDQRSLRFGINGGGPWPEKCNVPITAKDRTWYFHAKKDHATQQNPVVLKDCPAKPRRVTLMRTGERIDYTYRDGEFSFVMHPNPLKPSKSPMLCRWNLVPSLIRSPTASNIGKTQLPIQRYPFREACSLTDRITCGVEQVPNPRAGNAKSVPARTHSYPAVVFAKTFFRHRFKKSRSFALMHGCCEQREGRAVRVSQSISNKRCAATFP